MSHWTNLILTRSRPAHQPTTHIIGIIDQSLTFRWKQEKRAPESIPFFVLSAHMSQELHIFLIHAVALTVSSFSFCQTCNKMLSQRRSVIVCVVGAKGSTANMQYIILKLCVCVVSWFLCVSVCVLRRRQDFCVFVCACWPFRLLIRPQICTPPNPQRECITQTRRHV